MPRPRSRRGSPLRVRFFGVRGSCPCSSDAHQRYGGNTPCVAVEVGSDPPIVLDLGTGLRPLGLELNAAGCGDNGIQLTAFLSHLHWDHIIGLPFFPTVFNPGTKLEVYGPPQVGGSLHDVFERVLHPPFFPIDVEGLQGRGPIQRSARRGCGSSETRRSSCDRFLT